MPAISNSFKKQTKNLGKQAAKQILGEPFEILKTASNQVTGQEKSVPSQGMPSRSKEQLIEAKDLDEQKIKMKSQRLLEANQKELEDIRIEKIFKELQQRIAEGEDVPIEDYEELTMEQKQVLNAQKQAVKERNANQKVEEPLAEPTTRRKRNIIAGMEGKLEQIKKKREIRMPPSG